MGHVVLLVIHARLSSGSVSVYALKGLANHEINDILLLVSEGVENVLNSLFSHGGLLSTSLNGCCMGKLLSGLWGFGSGIGGGGFDGLVR